MTERVARSGHIGSILVLDGDELRRNLNSDLGFLKEDRSESVRRVAATANLLTAAGTIVIASPASPLAEDRAKALRNAREPFHEVFVRTTLDVYHRQDRKGLYERAPFGAIRQFTGAESPCKPPECPDLVIDMCAAPVSEYVSRLSNFVCTAVPIRVTSPNTRPAKSLPQV